MDRHTTAFTEKVKTIAAWRATHGALPSKNRPGAGATERSLAWFLTRQRTADVLPSARRAILTKHLPGWDEGLTWDEDDRLVSDRDARFRARLDQVAAWVGEHGRHPRISATQDEERSLATFLTHQRRAATGQSRSRLTPARRKMLNAAIPGWDSGLVWNDTGTRAVYDPNADFTAMAREYAAFLDRHSRHPRVGGEHERETALATWLKNTRSAAAGGTRGFTPARAAILDKHLPGWQERTGSRPHS